MDKNSLFINAHYSYADLSDDEKRAFRASLRDEYLSLTRLYSVKSARDDSSCEDALGRSRIDENRLEELANIYSEVKETDRALAEKIRTLASLMVMNSGNYFISQKNVRDFVKKYPGECSADEMWVVFLTCFESFDKKYEAKKGQGAEGEALEESVAGNRFIAYFKWSLLQRFKNIYNARERKIARSCAQTGENGEREKEYFNTFSLDETADDGESVYAAQVEDPNDDFRELEMLDEIVYYFSNLLTGIISHLGTDERRANKKIKRLYRAFYTGDTVALAKCDVLPQFFEGMLKREARIMNSCLDEFFDYIFEESVLSLEDVKSSQIKTYAELKSSLFDKKNQSERPALYIPRGEGGSKRFGFENLVYAAFTGTSAAAVSGAVERYDAFRNKYFSACM